LNQKIQKIFFPFTTSYVYGTLKFNKMLECITSNIKLRDSAASISHQEDTIAQPRGVDRFIHRKSRLKVAHRKLLKVFMRRHSYADVYPWPMIWLTFSFIHYSTDTELHSYPVESAPPFEIAMVHSTLISMLSGLLCSNQQSASSKSTRDISGSLHRASMHINVYARSMCTFFTWKRLAFGELLTATVKETLQNQRPQSTFG